MTLHWGWAGGAEADTGPGEWDRGKEANSRAGQEFENWGVDDIFAACVRRILAGGSAWLA